MMTDQLRFALTKLTSLSITLITAVPSSFATRVLLEISVPASLLMKTFLSFSVRSIVGLSTSPVTIASNDPISIVTRTARSAGLLAPRPFPLGGSSLLKPLICSILCYNVNAHISCSCCWS